MADGQAFINFIQRASKIPDQERTGLIMGKVTSISPITIKTDKLVLTEPFLVLGALVTECVINIPAMDETYRDDKEHRHLVPELTTSAYSGEYPHAHTVPAHYTGYELESIKLWRGLQVDDIVYLLRISGGQQFLVLQRKEGIT